MVGVRNAELMNTSVQPLDHFYFTDEINEIPGIGNLASRYRNKDRQPSTRLMAPVLASESNESNVSSEASESKVSSESEVSSESKVSSKARESKAVQYSSCMSSNYFLISILLILILSRQYAILAALLAAAWASYAVVYAKQNGS